MLTFYRKQVYYSNFSISELHRRWSNCVDAQAGLRLCCSHATKSNFLSLDQMYSGLPGEPVEMNWPRKSSNSYIGIVFSKKALILHSWNIFLLLWKQSFISVFSRMCQGYESPCRAVPLALVAVYRVFLTVVYWNSCPGCIFTRNHGTDDS